MTHLPTRRTMLRVLTTLGLTAGTATAHNCDDDATPEPATPPAPPEIEAVRVDAGETLALAPVGGDTA